jgi:hypothetical protein
MRKDLRFCRRSERGLWSRVPHALTRMIGRVRSDGMDWGVMDQISMKTPNPKRRLCLKID